MGRQRGRRSAPKRWQVAIATALCVLIAGSTALGRPPARSRLPGKPGLTIGTPRVDSKAAPLTLPIHAPPGADLSLWVNGRSDGDPFNYVGRGVWIADLSSADGLRPGADRLSVRADLEGLVNTAAATVRMPRDALLADAGPEKGTIVDQAIRVGAPPAGPGASPGLQRSWRIVRQPQGAHATLRPRSAAQPLLRATKPGLYVLSLTARLKGVAGASYDTLTVPASPNDPPIGAPIDTLGRSDGAIVIDGKAYGGGSGKTLSWVLLERVTRDPVQSGVVDADSGGIGTLIGKAGDYGVDTRYLRYVLIVSGRNGVLAGASRSTEEQLQKLVKMLGAPHLTAENFADLEHGQPFSIIGIPKAPTGAATERIPPLSHPEVSGAITGYLQKNPAVLFDGVSAYDYVSPEHPAFDTRAPGSTDTKNVITVGDDRYEASLSPDATAGLHVVMLNSMTLKPLDSAALTTNSRDPHVSDSALQGGAAEWISIRLDRFKDPTVLVQTIGKPKAASGRWEEVVGQLARLGANRQLVNALDGTNEYALAGTLGSDQPPAEASTAHDGPVEHPRPGQLDGVLERTRASTFEPAVAGAPVSRVGARAPVNLELVKTAYQPLQSWPELAPGQPRADARGAEDYMCKAIGFCQEADSCPSIRSCYWQRFATTNWSSEYSVLLGLKDPGGFGDAFGPVKDELLKEIKAVEDVQGWIVQLKEPLNKSAVRSYVDLQKIGNSIRTSVKAPDADNSTAWGLTLASRIVGLGRAVSPAASGISAALSLLAFLSEQKGPPILGTEITTRAEGLATDLLDRMQLEEKEIGGLGLLLVSDYGKLMAAQKHIKTDWNLEGASASENLRFAAKQWFYEALVPVAYPYLIRLDANNARDADCRIQGARAWPNQPDSMQMVATTDYGSSGQPIKNVFFFTRGILGGSSPPGTFDDDLWKPDPLGLGIEKLTFFTPELFGGQVVRAFQGKPWCDVGYLPHHP